MIDREARDRAADLVEQFWRGLITNFELERSWPDSGDEAIIAVDDLVYTLYSDVKCHTALADDVSNPKLNAIVQNCIAFLRSDEIYTWPQLGTIKGAEYFPRWAVVLSLGLLDVWNRRAEAKEARYFADMRAHGDLDAWPFSGR